MKLYVQIILAATTASLMTVTGMAQEKTTPKSDRSDCAPDREGQSHAASSDSRHRAAKATDLIGMTVNNYQEEQLGSVEDLAVDLESGRIVQVILSTGGFLGMGERLSAVPPGALHQDAKNEVLQLDANKDMLKNAPEFNLAKWTESSDPYQLSAVYSYYGQESAFNFIHKEESLEDTAYAKETHDTNETWNKNRVKGERQWMIPSSRLGQIQKASNLMGLTVRNRQDEHLGKVDNMLVDIPSGRIVAVIISSGGFLGMGNELSAVPPTALSFNAKRDTLQLDTTKDMMSAAPHFKADQWPDYNEPAYFDSVYRAYKQEPYFTSKTTAEADNTARNVRDRDDRTLTPFDQGNSQADTDITAQIRKGILAVKDMSSNAKNVKIITKDGRVTLRGPVKNEEEKRLIAEIANRIVRVENVDNQLEITLTTASN